MTTTHEQSQQSKSKRTRRLSPSLLVSFVALFVALSGAAVALPGTDTVNSGDIVDNSIKSADLKDDKAVESVDVVDETLGSNDLGQSSVASDEVAQDTLTADDLSPNAAGASEIGDQIHRHTNSVTVGGGAGQNANYQLERVTAVCAAGEELISATGEWSNDVLGEELFISEVDVNHNNESVTVTGGNDSGNDRNLVAVASCLG